MINNKYMEKIVYYSDKPIVTMNEEGFILDFRKDKNNVDEEIDYGFRIGMSPLAAKKFLYTLFAQIGSYEKENGEIKIKSLEIEQIIKDKPAPMGFKTSN